MYHFYYLHFTKIIMNLSFIYSFFYLDNWIDILQFSSITFFLFFYLLAYLRITLPFTRHCIQVLFLRLYRNGLGLHKLLFMLFSLLRFHLLVFAYLHHILFLMHFHYCFLFDGLFLFFLIMSLINRFFLFLVIYKY